MREISLSSIISIILHRLWLVILVAALCGGIAFGYFNYAVTPVYSARASILITNGGLLAPSYSDSIQTNDLSASIYLVDTCVDILKSQEIYQELSEAIIDPATGEKKYSFQQLKSGFSISRRGEENLFIDISFKSTNKEEAVAIVNAFRDICPSFMSGKLNPVTVVAMDRAYGASMVYPSVFSSMIIYGFLGAAATCVLLVLFASLDQTIKSEEDFAETFNIPVLGAVPDFDNSPTYAYRSKTGSVSTGG